MIKARKVGMMLLVTFLIGCIAFAGCLLYTRSIKLSTEGGGNVTSGMSDVLIELLDDSTQDPDGTGEVLSGKRLSQKLTVTTDEGVLAVSGTVTKVQDAFYPGSYELKFARNAILSSRAQIQVQMEVNKGEEVHILTGDRENGFTEFASVIVTQENRVSFYTSILQDYTLSTTDIMSAQAAMADMLGSTEN